MYHKPQSHDHVAAAATLYRFSCPSHTRWRARRVFCWSSGRCVVVLGGAHSPARRLNARRTQCETDTMLCIPCQITEFVILDV